MLKIYRCAGCSAPVNENRAFVESDRKGNMRHFHTRDECFIKWHNKKKELDDLSVSRERADM